MGTQFFNASDGTCIAFDTTGSGAPLVLLHGGGQSRRSWHEKEYVARLATDFQVITIDLRGSGESDRPTHESAYKIEKLTGDILGVADLVGARHFALWGFSWGANIGRYLASQTGRLTRFVMGGVPFGSATPGEWGQRVRESIKKWEPIFEAKESGALDRDTLPPEDREKVDDPALAIWLGIWQAMVAWPDVWPDRLRCPTLLLYGSAAAPMVELMSAHEKAVLDAGVQIEVIDGLDHMQEFTEIDAVLPVVKPFLRAA